jgi:hypothetical protein
MEVINWPRLLPSDDEFNEISDNLEGVQHIRTIIQALVRSVIKKYPWEGRLDLVPLIDPSKIYHTGELVALPETDPQGLRPDTWRIGIIKSVIYSENPIQGPFQVVILDVDGQRREFAATLPQARPSLIIFPQNDEEAMEWLISDFTDTYNGAISNIVNAAIHDGRICGKIYGDQILIGEDSTLIGEHEQFYIEQFFFELNNTNLWLTTDEILSKLHNLDCLTVLPQDLACFILQEELTKLRYIDLGGGRWTTADLFISINRPLDRRLLVPRVRSQILQAFGEEENDLLPDTPDELPEEAQQVLSLYDEEPQPVEKQAEWQPPSAPIQLPTFTYLHIREGYFPLGNQLVRAFNAQYEQTLVSIQIIQGEPQPFLIDQHEGVLKALDLNQFHQAFRYENFISPGTKLWLEYRSENLYRLYPKPLHEPRNIQCKLIRLDNQRHLVVEEQSIPIMYESEANVFRAELRFEEMDALFAEAEQLGWSILDTIYHTFAELSVKNPDVVVHHSEMFNMVFFRYRMCSPFTVIAMLYKHPCFVQVGEGNFRFDPTLGFSKTIAAGQRKQIGPSTKRIPGRAHIQSIKKPSQNVREVLQLKDVEGALARENLIKILQEYGEVSRIYIGQSKSFFRVGQSVVWIRFSKYNQGAKNYWYDLTEKELNELKLIRLPIFVLYICGNEQKTLVIPFKLLEEMGIYRAAKAERRDRWIQYIYSRDTGLDLALWTHEENSQRVDVTPYLNNFPLLLGHDFGRESEDTDKTNHEESKEIWSEVISLVGRKLNTLDQHKPFHILRVTENTAEIETSTGNLRNISRKEIEMAWKILFQSGHLSRVEIQKHYSEFNPAFVAAILSVLPGVQTTSHPIRLIYLQHVKTESNTYFIFQQSTHSEYADHPGTIYNWRQGIPGSNQITTGAQFIYYRTKEKVFFGSGSIERIETYQDDNGQTYSNGFIADYQPWEPPLPLSQELAEHLTFISPDRLWVGQAGIRQITSQDFEIILNAYQASLETVEVVSSPESKKLDEDKSIHTDLTKFPPTQPISPEFNKKGQGHFLPKGPLFEISSVQSDQTPTEPILQSSSAQPRPSRIHPVGTKEMQAKTLFSFHYLNNRLPDHPEWQDDPTIVFNQVRQLWNKATQYGNTWNEAQTEDEFVRPILTYLGWNFIVQAKAGHGGRVTRPDYALFADHKTRDDAYPHQGNDDAFYTRTLAIAEAKYWGRPLSQQDQSGRSTWKAESNPSHQMVSYLVGTRCPWGILTNGIIWRLYSREVSSTASEYYEIDLSLIFDFLAPDGQPSPEQRDAFQRWWLFYRLEAFLPDPQGKSFLTRVHEGSATYARQVSEKLKELIFEEVMPEIAGGFVTYRRQQMEIVEETPESLSEIYRASLSLLYKLLFLLYAEARSLLPMDNPDYRSNSLTNMAEWAAQQIDQKRKLSDSTYATPRYDTLIALFRRVDHGDPSLGIPHYNGGLFNLSTPENQFLESHKLCDLTVAKAVDILVRDQGLPVDYAYISVRNLGAIYEGLLENKLAIVPSSSIQEKGLKVELVNDKGERKATGSYYTPDYIVEYIVEHTLDPILEAKRADYESAMERLTEIHKKLETTADPATNRLLQSELTEAELQAREAFLGIKVLDPAMGSGHFLVNAVDHLTDGIIERMQVYHDSHPSSLWEWDPIQQLIERVRVDIGNEMAGQGLIVDIHRLDDTALLTRLVMKRCIYGVDLNRMAVELAKVSLWLHSFTVGAPLSFLDHHLRWGNSLIGIDVRTVESAIRKQEQKGGASQFSLFAGPFAGLLDLTTVMTEVAERADATLADVRKSSQDFESFQRSLIPYKQVLDLWVSQYYGNNDAMEFLTLFGGDVLPALRGERQVTQKYQQAIEKALQIYTEKRFFHWDLEFPEVFVDLRRRNWAENGGFNAVIGNPPYVRPHHLNETTKNILWKLYPQTYQAKSDILNCFIQKGIDVSVYGGHLGMITADSWMLLSSAKGLREYILEHASVIGLGLLPVKVFEDASVSTGTVHLRKEQDSQSRRSNQILIVEVESENLVAQFTQDAYWQTDEKTFFTIAQPVYDLRKKVEDISVSLNEIADVDFGLKTGDDEKFLRYQKIEPEDKPLVSSKSVDRFSINWDGVYVWYVPDIMIKHRNTARPGDTGRFEIDKVIVSRMSERLSCSIDTERFYVKDALLIHNTSKYSLGYLSALINSKLLDKYYGSVFTTLDLHRNELLRLPIRRINFAISNETLSTKLAGIQGLYSSGILEEILVLVKGCLAHTPEQAEIVHQVLAYLAEKMIEFNKAKQREVRGFLGWLERETGAPLDSLTGKTALENYIGDYQKGEEPASLEQILAVLKKNQNKLNVDISGRDFQECLVKEYETSLGNLLPIKQKLASTDRLIDQIVYALYDLTEEEIAVVEGRTS